MSQSNQELLGLIEARVRDQVLSEIIAKLESMKGRTRESEAALKAWETRRARGPNKSEHIRVTATALVEVQGPLKMVEIWEECTKERPEISKREVSAVLSRDKNFELDDGKWGLISTPSVEPVRADAEPGRETEVATQPVPQSQNVL
ncbi:MAG: hypothetical protein F4060_08030 [Holophagales bacterium]|nr:hypothetical protein [Holophagales bacterium]MYG29607.1 hypothetical protein [Holophagales bacterium]MYI79875.1 hypothetical protein [Holophagales bacterium]